MPFTLPTLKSWPPPWLGDAIGIACGLVAWPAYLGVIGKVPVYRETTPQILVLVTSLCALAGVLAAAFSSGKNSLDSNSLSSARQGKRAGLIAALVAGGMIVGAARYATGPYLSANYTLYAALLSVLPGLLAGTMAGALTASFASPAPVLVAGGMTRKTVLPTALAIVISLAGFISPWLPSLPRPLIVPQSTSPVAKSTPAVVIAPPAPPSKPYHKPPEWDKKPARSWILEDSYELGMMNPSATSVFSADCSQIAMGGRDDPRQIEVVDLHSHRSLLSQCMNQPVNRLAFSENSQRLFVICGTGGESECFLVDLKTSQHQALPLPAGNDVPKGLLSWDNPNQVLFLGESEKISSLDLETLTISSQEKPKAGDSSMATQKQAYIAKTKGAQLGFLSVPVVKENTLRHPGVPPAFTYKTLLAARDEGTGYGNPFPGLDREPSDQFLASSDATKLLRIRNRRATVFYFSSRETPELRFETLLASPMLVFSGESQKELENAGEYQLCAYIYTPLNNPLNGKPVGPNRSRVKALARLASWKESKAVLWIAEEYEQVSTNDILADLHIWKEAEAQWIQAESGKPPWWSPITPLAGSPPIDLAKASPLDRDEKYQAKRDGSFFVVELVRPNPPKPAKPDPPASLPPDNFRLPFTPPIPEVNEMAARPMGIAEFIVAHHAKAVQGDLMGMVSDYAERVDHFTNGMVGRDFILKDEQEYHSKFTDIQEEVLGQITTAKQDNGKYRVSYQLRSSHRKIGETKPVEKILDIRMTLDPAGTGLLISSHKASTR